MPRCPACDGVVADGTVCPECGTGIERQQSADRRPRRPADQPRRRPTTGDGTRQRFADQPPLPAGIKLLCGLLVLSGLGSLFVGGQLQSIGQTAVTYGASGAGRSLDTLGLAVLAFGVGELLAAAGLWTRASWGWTAGMGVSGGGILTSAVLLADPFTSTVGLIGLLLNAGIGWYIYHRRWVFREEPRSEQNRIRPQQDRQRGP